MDEFNKFMQKMFEKSLGKRFSKDSIDEILSDVLNSILDYLLNQEDGVIDLEFGKIKLERGEKVKLEYTIFCDEDEIKNEYYFQKEDDLDINIFEDDGDEFEPEEDEVAGVNFSDEDDDLDISDILYDNM